MLDYNTVLFDMDGTILDTLEDSAASVNHMCRHFGVPERTLEEVSAGMGRGIGHLVEVSLPEGGGIDKNEAVRVYREYYGEHYLDRSKPYEGVLELMAELKGAGARIAVISNKVEEYTRKIVDKLFGGYVDVCVGETPGFPLKPDPAPVMKALEQLGSTKSDAVYVGDTEVDMQTAKNSGTACITCAWGLRGAEFLLQNGAEPDNLADTPMDVFRILGGA